MASEHYYSDKEIFELSNRTGCTTRTIRRRIALGKSVKPEILRKHATIFEIDGIRRSLKELSGDYGISSEALRSRIRSGWSIERALSTPVADGRKDPEASQ